MKKFNLLFALITICFSVFSQAPTITSFSPDSGPVGTLVTIIGINLSSPTAFTIGGVPAILVSVSSDSIVGMVMPGALTGTIAIITSGGNAIGSSNFTVTVTGYPVTQQGGKHVGNGAVGASGQGYAIGVSADGNTAVVGGSSDSSSTGAIWIYTRSGTTWSQQGSKLVGTGYVRGAAQGASVAISADGNTVIEGGYFDDYQIGAAWVFTRTGTTWTQQGSKLVGTGAVSSAQQGISVALSADGNTAAVGGLYDSTSIGAVWVYIRSGGIWSQQGSKLVGSGAVGGANQGYSLAISADGNTILVGGNMDSNNLGAAWIFIRSGSTWTQQGNKLVGTGWVGNNIDMGRNVALSADGNTAAIGGDGDNSRIGAVWIFTRSGNLWTQQGNKLVGTGAIGASAQGTGTGLSADGNSLVVGGWNDNGSIGATWVYTRSCGVWSQRGQKLIATGATGDAGQGIKAVISADGTTSMIGGNVDNGYSGASWFFISDTNSSSPGYGSSFSHSICAGDSYSFNGRSLASAGIYIDTMTSAGGCDSIVTLTLTLNPLPVVSLSWDSLLSEHVFFATPGDTILFICGNCQQAYSPSTFALAGGNPPGGFYTGVYIQNDTFSLPTSNPQFGNNIVYYTYTDSSGCSATAVDSFSSGLFEGIKTIPGASLIHLYPNPNKGSFTLQTSNSIGIEYTISDMLGHVIMQQTIKSDNDAVELPDASEGVYTLTVKGSQPFRFVIVR